MCTTGVSPHTPLSSPPCRLQPLLLFCSVLFCSVCFGVILLFLWRGCIQLYIYYTTLLVFTAVLHIHHCGDELTKSQQLPLHDWLHIAVYIVKQQFTIYMLRTRVYKERREGGHYNELVLYPLMMTACGDTRDWISLADNHQPSDEASTLSHLLENYFKKDGARTFLICYSVWDAYSVWSIIIIIINMYI